ncbi:MAG: tetratricopeptide repeat protein [bacterium]|nr:tetratricopeptide repeat protein [bacterium]
MPGFYNVSITKLEKEKAYRVTWRDIEANSEDYFEAEAPDLGQAEIHADTFWPGGQEALNIGSRIFNFLDGDARHFSRALSDAEAEGKTLELRITTCRHSHDWPLELVARDGEFLVRSKLFLVRTAGRRETVTVPPPKRPLKLLFMAGSAMDVKPLLDFEKEEETIFKVTEKLAVDLEVEDSGTLEGLAERLLHEKYDVVHLAGHADINRNNMPYFILEDETGRERSVTCDVLWKEALIENPPQLLFLSGCKTGQSGCKTGQAGLPGQSGQAVVVSFARMMVEHFPVPAVLGWGRSVQDDQASVAAEFIYRELCRGRSLPEAVQRARLELMDRFAGRPKQAWPLLRLFCKSTPPAPLVAKGQKAKPKPRKLTHTYLKDSRVKILAEGFIGRRRQLQQCLRVLKEADDKIGVLLQGTGGLGKSCLAGKLCERFSKHHLIVVHGIFNDISLQKALDLAFTMSRDKQGQEILQEQKEMADKLKALCATSFKNNNYLFVLDDFEQNLEGAKKGTPGSLTVSAVQLLSVLLSLLPFCGKETQMIVTCRYGFSLTSDGRDLVKERLETVTLTGLLHAEQLKKARELPHILDYPNGKIAFKLLAAGFGNPRLMEWIDILVGEMGQAEVPALLKAVKDKQEEFVRSHVLRQLVAKGGAALDAFLSAFSIYRIPVLKEGVLHIGRLMGFSEGDSGVILESGVGLSLVEQDSARGTFQVTPLLREELVVALAEKESWHRAVVEYFGEVWLANEKEDKFDAGFVEELVYHALACGEEEVATLIGGRLVDSLRESLAFAESRRVGEWVLEGKRQPLGNEYDALLLNATGTTYLNMGDNRKAKENFEQALSISKDIHGDAHQDTAAALTNLGEAFRALGDFEKVIEYSEEGLKITRAVFGNGHSNVAIHLNNLGGAWDNLGDCFKAITYYEQALIIFKKVFGEKHQNTATTLNNLGAAWRELGDNAKAIEYFETALEIDRAVFGYEHPKVAIRLTNLGLTWNNIGDNGKSIEYFGAALKIDRDVFGNEHPVVAINLNNLGGAWGTLGDNGKAIEYYKAALKIDRVVFGNEHPAVARELNNLGTAYFEQGKMEKAKEFLQKAYDIFNTVYGPEHPDTKNAALWLADC